MGGEETSKTLEMEIGEWRGGVGVGRFSMFRGEKRWEEQEAGKGKKTQ